MIPASALFSETIQNVSRDAGRGIAQLAAAPPTGEGRVAAKLY